MGLGGRNSTRQPPGSPRLPTQATTALRVRERFHMQSAVMLAVVVAAAVCGSTRHSAVAFRVHNPEVTPVPLTPAYFEPYADGFTGRSGEPTNPGRIRVNEGNQFTRTQPNIFEGTHPRQRCPGMIGPLSDGYYYCTRKEAGYCDRRSGACFCNRGYSGSDCSQCLSSHFLKDGLCQPKKLCPNDCSGQGECDYNTGTCKCNINRVGADCGTFFCAAQFDQRCIACDSQHCTLCVVGFFITPDDRCDPCTLYDPRCTSCNSTQCQTCGDPLLLSTRRSGRRVADTQLPDEELQRVLSIAIPFGSQSRYAFEEGEPFDTLDPKTSLKDRAKTCLQGGNDDATWACQPTAISNIVCGHIGTLQFTSPEYAIIESGGHIRLTVVRSGGGYGATSVEYTFQHKTSSDSDVTATAYYTSQQRLEFDEGVVSASFLITIHDDLFLEQDEEFILTLRDATNGAALGPQRACAVKILDDDKIETHPNYTHAHGPALSEPIIAGDTASFTILAGTFMGQHYDGELFVVEHRDWYTQSLGDLGFGGNTGVYDYVTDPAARIGIINGDVTPQGNGSYLAEFVPERAGNLSVWVQLATPGGLLGEYFDNTWFLDDPVISRVDRVVNFTWDLGRLTQSATDYVSARWTGKIRTEGAGTYRFYTQADDNVRLYIDYELLVDRWDAFCNDSWGEISLEANRLYDIRVEYRDREGDAHMYLSWYAPTAGIPKRQIIPMDNLYVVRHISGSPYQVTVMAAAPSVYGTTVSDTGVVGSTAGLPATFYVHSRDVFGNDRLDAGAEDDYQVTATLVTPKEFYGGQGLTEISGAITFDTTTKLHVVTYTADIAGMYDLSVLLRASQAAYTDIVGSPFRVWVPPAATSASVCDLSGQGVISGVAGEIFPFHITSRDYKRNLRRVGGDAFDVRAYHTTVEASYVGSFHDYGNGTYKGIYRPLVAGTYMTRVTLDGVDVTNSPYTVVVHYAATAGARCIARGDGLSKSVSDQTASFLVFMRDAFDNARDVGGDTFQVLTSIPSTHTVRDFHNGTYLVQYVPTKAGPFTLRILVNGEEITGSPFHPICADGISVGSTSTAVGDGLFRGMTGVDASFIVQIRDINGNDRTYGGDHVTADLNTTRAELDADGVMITETVSFNSTVKYIGSGRYEVHYVPTVAHTHTLKIAVNGLAIHGSPFSPVIIPNVMNATMSVATGSGLAGSVAGVLGPVHIRAVDAFGNDVLRGGSASQLFADVSGPIHQTLEITDLKDGGYSLPYVLNVAGDYDLTVDLMVSGRLRGQLFSKVDLLDPLVTRYDTAIDFDWGLGVPHPAFANSEYFSARWTGFLRTDHDEVHTFIVQVNGDARLYLNDEMVLNAWPSVSPYNTQSVRLQANTYYRFQLDYSTQVGNSSVRLLWQAPSIPQQVIPASAFFLRDALAGSPFHPVIVPAPTSARNCIAMGNGLHSAVANIQATFTVRLRDAFNNTRGVGGDVVAAEAVRTSRDGLSIGGEAQIIPVSITDLGDGDYTAVYTPVVAGLYALRVTVNALPVHADLGVTAVADSITPFLIENSPFVLVVADGVTVSAKSSALGDALYNAEAGVLREFQVQARDINGNDRSVGLDTISVVAQHRFQSKVSFSGAATYLQSGLYSIKYTAEVSGTYDLAVKINGVAVPGSPFTLVVVPTNVYGPLCIATGTETASVNASGIFRILSQDRFGNPVTTGGDKFVVRLTGPGVVSADETITTALVQDYDNGTYTATYFPKYVGEYLIDVRFADATSPGLRGEYYANLWGTGNPDAVAVDSTIVFGPSVYPGAPTLRTAPWSTTQASVVWTGYVRPTASEYYTFHVTSSDGTRLFVGREMIVDALDDGAGSRSGQVSFQFVAGQLYEIQLEFRQKTQPASLKLEWSSPSTTKAIIPSENLYPIGVPIKGSPFTMMCSV